MIIRITKNIKAYSPSPVIFLCYAVYYKLSFINKSLTKPLRGANFMKNQSIKVKIVLIMVTVTFITTAVISVARVIELQNRARDNVADRLENNVAMSNIVYSEMMRYSWALLDAIHALPQVQSVVRGGSREAASAAMNGLFKVNIDVGGFFIYNNFLVFDSDFNTIASANPSPMTSARSSPYVGYLPMAERGITWASNVTISSVTGHAQIWITKPLMEGNRFLGMVAIPLNIQGLTYFLESVDYEVGSYYTVITDPIGVVAYSNHPDYIGKNLVDLGMAPSLVQLKKNTLFEYTSTVSGNRDLAYLIVEPDMDWMIISGIDHSSVMATRTEIILGILPFVLGLIASGLAMFFFVVLTLKPLGLLARTLNDIANGEGDLTARLQETGAKEIADVSRYFNQTLEKIRNLVQSIKTSAKTLSEIGSDLASSMDETASAKNQIVATIQNINSRIRNQGTSVSETHSIMEQLAASIGKLNTQVENQGNEISQASASVEEMVANIQSVRETLVHNSGNVSNLRESAEAGRGGLVEVAGDIKEIARESEGLMEINSVMENIASQTNLLSMNAAIEAAHAGEAGKGFAVVADEIRKLAESSSEQSKTIGTVLKKIKTSIDKITASTDKVLNKFEAIDSSVKTVADQEDNIRRAMEEQGQGSRQLLTGTANVNDITREVQDGTTEMRKGAQNVIRESESLEKSTQEITSGMNEMASEANHIDNTVNHVNEISSRNREAVAALIKDVSRFKVD